MSLIDGVAGYLYILLTLEAKTWLVATGNTPERSSLITKLHRKIALVVRQVLEKFTHEEQVTSMVT